MLSTLKIIKELKNIQGTNAKIEYLNHNKDNELLKHILRVVYDPTISTKISDKKIDKEVVTEFFIPPMDYTDFLHFISNDCTGKDVDILTIQTFIATIPQDDLRQLLREITTQSLTLGMDVKNINKAYGYSMIKIPLEPMLAFPLEKRLDKIEVSTKFSASLKLDGFRVLIKYTDDGNLEGYSRNGLELEGFENFLEEIKERLPKKGMVYDGELLTQKVYKDSQEGYKALSKLARKKGCKNKDKLCFHCFDAIPIEDMENKVSKKPYKERYKDVWNIKESPYIKRVKSLGVFTVDDPKLYTLLDDIVADGGEGVMLNSLDGLYSCKRSTEILKMKKFWTCDLKVLAVEKGKGNLSKTLGNIIVEYKGHEVRVGSGFTLEERELYWNNPNLLIGNVVEISYFEETRNDKGTISLRFPTFKCLRLDKTEPSYN